MSRALLDAADVARVVDRIAHQILEKTDGARDTVLLGIPTRGVPLARRLAARIRAFEGVEVPVGTLDITLYRDDLRLRGARALGRPTCRPAGSTASGSSSSTTCSSPAAPSGPPSTRCATSAGRARCSSPCWSTAATGSCRSAPTTSARTSRPRSRRACGCC